MNRWFVVPAVAASAGVVAHEAAVAAPAELDSAEVRFGLGGDGEASIRAQPAPGHRVKNFTPTKTADKGVTFTLVGGDTLKVAPVGAERTFTGKRVTFDVEALIVREYKRNCKKVEEKTPFAERGWQKGPELRLGDQVKLEVRVEYKQGGAETLTAGYDRPVAVRMKDSAVVTVRVVYDPTEVAFAGRGATEAEVAQYVTPEVNNLKRARPSYRDVRATNVRVEPGDLTEFAARVTVERDR
jgi:hypothetical protein